MGRVCVRVREREGAGCVSYLILWRSLPRWKGLGANGVFLLPQPARAASAVVSPAESPGLRGKTRDHPAHLLSFIPLQDHT